MKKRADTEKILVVGYGSMGRRRIRLIKELVENVKVSCVDSSAKRRCQAEAEGWECFADLKTALKNDYDLAFVCIPPGNHANAILQLVEARIHVFTELNLNDDRYEEIIKRAEEMGVTVFMSSTMLYNKQIEKIKEYVMKTDKSLNYIYHVGQYLPDWHPWESYKDFFASKVETNGVKEIFAIQLPWIIDVFGQVDLLYAMAGKYTDLEISFHDCTAVSMKHKNGNTGIFVADVVSRKATVSLEVIGEDLHLFWNGCSDGLYVYNLQMMKMEQIQVCQPEEHLEGYADIITEGPYRDEIRDFLKTVYDGGIPRYSLWQDKYTLSVISRIEGMDR